MVAASDLLRASEVNPASAAAAAASRSFSAAAEDEDACLRPQALHTRLTQRDISSAVSAAR